MYTFNNVLLRSMSSTLQPLWVVKERTNLMVSCIYTSLEVSS